MRCLIRADVGCRMGTGHVMRCLALTQAWRETGGAVTFRTTCTVPGLLARLAEGGAEVEVAGEEPGSPEDADRTREAAARLGAGWLALGGDHLSGDFQRRARGDGARLLALDDYGHVEHYWADLVLNQNLHAGPELYADRAPHTRLLLGTRFALLRREFWNWQQWKRIVPEVGRKVL